MHEWKWKFSDKWNIEALKLNLNSVFHFFISKYSIYTCTYTSKNLCRWAPQFATHPSIPSFIHPFVPMFPLHPLLFTHVLWFPHSLVPVFPCLFPYSPSSFFMANQKCFFVSLSCCIPKLSYIIDMFLFISSPLLCGIHEEFCAMSQD